MNWAARILLQILFLSALATAPAYAQDDFTGERFPYRAFDQLPKTTIGIGGATLDVRFAPSDFPLPRSGIMAWLERSAKAASVYFGKFPVSSARILIVPAPGSDVQGGASWGFAGAAIRLFVGSEVTDAEFRDDWVAVHEMTHLAEPDIREPYLGSPKGPPPMSSRSRGFRPVS